MLFSHRRGRVGVLLGITAALSTVLLSACSGSSAGSISASNKPLPTVRFAAPEDFTVLSDLYIAEQMGWFKKLGINVEVTNYGINAVGTVIAGRADIAVSGLSASMSPSAKGKQANILYAATSGGNAVGIFTAPKSKYTTLMDLSGQSVSVNGVGTATYGAAKLWSAYIVQHGGKALKLVIAENKTEQSDAVVSGRVAALISVESPLLPLIDSGKLRVLVDAKSAVAKQVFGPISGPSAAVSVGYWGMQSWIAPHKNEVVEFLAAIREGDVWLQSHTSAQAGTVLAKATEIKRAQLDQSQATESWNSDKPFEATTLGLVSKQAWSNSLGQFNSYQLGFSTSNPKFGYGTLVTMKYLQQAATLDHKTFGGK